MQPFQLNPILFEKIQKELAITNVTTSWTGDCVVLHQEAELTMIEVKALLNLVEEYNYSFFIESEVDDCNCPYIAIYLKRNE